MPSGIVFAWIAVDLCITLPPRIRPQRISPIQILTVFMICPCPSWISGPPVSGFSCIFILLLRALPRLRVDSAALLLTTWLSLITGSGISPATMWWRSYQLCPPWAVLLFSGLDLETSRGDLIKFAGKVVSRKPFHKSRSRLLEMAGSLIQIQPFRPPAHLCRGIA